MFGEFFFLGIGSILSNILFTVMVLVIAVAVGGSRGQPDPQGHRLKATYLCIVLFFSLFTALFAATSAMDSLMDLTRDETDSYERIDVPEHGIGGEGFFDEPGDPATEDAAAGLTGSLFVAGAAAGVLAYHRKR